MTANLNPPSTMRYSFPILAAYLSLAFAAAAIIPEDRLTDWSHAGVRGGQIPQNWPLFASVKQAPYNAVGDGIADDTLAISNCVKSATGSRSVVYFPPGTYRITRPIFIGSGRVILRGATDGVSKILATGSANALNIGNSSSYNPVSVPLTGGLQKGSTTVNVASSTGFAPGHLVLIDQLNDTAGAHTGFKVDIQGIGTPATWVSRNSGSRALGQHCVVTAVTPTSISFAPPLNSSYQPALSPEISRQQFATVDVGVENLQFEDAGNTTSGRHVIAINNTANFWITDCTFDKSLNGFIYINRSVFGDIHRNWLRGGIQHIQNRSYGIEIGTQSAAILVYDNIVGPDVRSPFHAQWGASGCVFAYNYCVPVKINDASPGTTVPDYSGNHGAHPMLNLFEGNSGNAFRSDFLFGTSSHYTLLRNHFYGNGHTFTNGTGAVDIARGQTFYNVVGNVLGGGNAIGVTNTVYTFEIFWGQTGVTASFNKPYIRTLGYYTTGYGGPGSTEPKDTLIWHGNYDYANRQTIWDDRIPQRDIPASLYLTARPAWWGSLLWPPIGPDVPGLVSPLPAQLRYEAEGYPRPSPPANFRRLP